MFPVLGAVRTARALPDEGADGAADGVADGAGGAAKSYVLFQRREDGDGAAERYEPVGSFPNRPPSVDEITQLVPRSVQPMSGGTDGPEASEPTATATSGGGDDSDRRGPKPNSATDKFAAPSWD